MCLHMFKEEETALKPFRVYQSSALSLYSTGNLNYYHIISWLDSLPTATYFEVIQGVYITSSERKAGNIQHSLNGY